MNDFYKDIDVVWMPLNGKRPIIPNWQDLNESIDPRDNQNCGIVCGSNSNIIVVDIDTSDDGKAMWDEFKKDLLPNVDDTLIVLTPSGGYHYYFQYDADIPTMAKCVKVNGSKIGVDVRSDKGQVVSAGSIYYSEKPNKKQFNGLKYKFMGDPYMKEIIKVPPLLKDLLLGKKEIIHDEFGWRASIVNKNKHTPILHNHDDVNVDKFTKAVMGLSSERYDDRDNWLKVIFAIGHMANITGKDLSPLAIRFSEQSDKYESEDDVLEKYSKADGKITSGTIYHMLREDNPELYSELTSHNKTNMLNEEQIALAMEMFEKADDDVQENPNIPLLRYYHDAEHIVANRYSLVDIHVWIKHCIFKICNSGKTRWVVKDICPITKKAKLTILDAIPFFAKDDARKIKLKDNDDSLELWKVIRDFCNGAGCSYKQMDCYPYFFEEDKQSYPLVLNTWMGFPQDYTRKEYKSPPFCIQHWIDHFKFVCDGDDTLVNWLAHMIQKPQEKSFNIMMEGKKGLGKSIIFEAIARMLGEDLSCQINNLDNICGTFNSILENKIIVNINECTNFTKKRDENVLKSLCTEKRININRKNQAQYQTNFYGRFLITTNNRFGIRISSDDRRNYCISVNPKYKGNKAYFKPMVDDINSNNKAVFALLFNYLANLDISSFDHTMPKMTQFKQSLIGESVDPIIDYLKEFNQGIRNEHMLNYYKDEKQQCSIINGGMLYSDYKCYMNEQGEPNARIKKKKCFFRFIEDLGFKYKVYYRDGSSTRGFNFNKDDLEKAITSA
jgi:hypothetical protein